MHTYGPCTSTTRAYAQVDLFEANNHAMQTALHTELGGSYGSGNCDRNGCFERTGGPRAEGERTCLTWRTHSPPNNPSLPELRPAPRFPD